MHTSIDARRNITIWVAVRIFAERASPSHSPTNVGVSNMSNLTSTPLVGAVIETPFSPSTANKINISAAVITRTANPYNLFLLRQNIIIAHVMSGSHPILFLNKAKI
jgi:hypothetical protein